MAVKKGPRFRKRDVKTKDTLVGREWVEIDGILVGQPASYVRPKTYTASATRLGERCWDEVHRPEYTLYTYDRGLIHPGIPENIPYADPEDLFGATALGRTLGFRRKTRPRKPSYLNPKGFRRPVRSSRVWNSGGPFYIIKASNPWYYVQGNARYSRVTGVHEWFYEGGFVPTSFGSGQMSSMDLQYESLESSATPGDASGWGAEGWNKSRPKVETGNMAQAIWEAREAPQMLETTADFFQKSWKAVGGHPTKWGPKGAVQEFMSLHGPKELSNQFLNNQFGWFPFLNDLLGLYKTQRDYERRLLQLMRDNGQYVKRRRFLRKQADAPTNLQYSSTPLVWPNMYSYLYDYEGPNFGHTYTYVEQTDDIWFEGKFSYYIPAFDQSLYDQRPDLAALYGATQWATMNGFRFSPSLLWKITPWSWLADWFSNAGDVIANITASAEDNLHAKYAYIMRHMTKRAVNDTTLYTVNGNTNLFWYQEIETKHRDVASPYGFNLTWDDFSPTQLAILAALGLSRM